MPVLSIVIPHYNEGAFIGKLLERILAVSVESLGFDKEIIVVNEGYKNPDVTIIYLSAVERLFVERLFVFLGGMRLPRYR
jgi:hypothetical protein